MKDAGGEIHPGLAGCTLQGGLAVSTVLIGASVPFREVLRLADAVAANDCIVLLEGESGTGKELLARRIHARSRRSSGPFIPVNCPGISSSLFESQFYGHVRGAFTGAATDTLGVVRAAEGGTLLLDEIGELPLHLQPKLLRLLQQREVTPVGASRPIAVDVRFVAATNSNLARRAAAGKFRPDLYHRLNIVRIVIPSLRQRPEDIALLLDYYLDYYAQLYEMPVCRLSPRLRDSLLRYPWPGNVRELCAYVERLYAAKMAPAAPQAVDWDDRGVAILPSDESVAQEDAPPSDEPGKDDGESLNLAQAEADMIRRALELTRYNCSAAAKLLQIHRTTLHRKIRALGLDR
ncbi:MAG: sigma 54-interacting transcriptional regulator [Phycisphaerae bacterium]|nr:sigma 54-interacting transcriptional regulator [Phycisphaerae bacterium]